MGMILKSLLAGVVLAGVAGGGVYYGLSPVEGTSLNERFAEPINPKSVTVKKVADAGEHPHPERKTSAYEKDRKKNTKAESHDKKTHKNEVAEAINANEPVAAPAVKKSWIDQYINKSAANDTSDEPSVELEMQDMPQNIVESEMVTESLPLEIEMYNDGTMPPEPDALSDMLDEMDMATSRAKAKGDYIVTEDKPSGAIGTQPSYDTIGLIMREAAQIESTDLRDRAYLSAVDYALAHKYFGKAKKALEQISQPELRETARSRIGVHYAGTGNPEAAFELVDTVEIADFKDAMRIQIIEALIAAEGRDHGHP